MKTMNKRSLALFLISALLAGLLPLFRVVSIKAVGYGLNNPRTDDERVITWDCIWFGNYWQEDTNGDGIADKNDDKTPIKWRVLSVENNDAFLVADKNLDYQRYSNANTDITWETCTMRSWLNGYGADKNKDGEDYSDNNFLDNAFSAGEQSAIRITNIANNDNPKYGTAGGNDTLDKVYLLSADEVTNPQYGFTSSYGSDNARMAVNTAYTASGGEFGGEYISSAGTAGDWWLRTPGLDRGLVSFIYGNGYVNMDGKKAFYGCKKLKSITIKTKKLKSKSVGTQAFLGLHKKAVIKVPKKQKKIYTKWLKKKGLTKKMKIK